MWHSGGDSCAQYMLRQGLGANSVYGHNANMKYRAILAKPGALPKAIKSSFGGLHLCRLSLAALLGCCT